VPERDRDDDQVIVADLDQDAVVTDSASPVAGESPGQPLAARAWIVELAKLLEMGLDTAQHLRIQLAGCLLELR
jgi:hypothetical protein